MAERRKAGEAPTFDSKRYFVARRGELVGPVPADQLRAWVAQGMLDAMVRAEDGPWLDVRSTPFAPAPPVAGERSAAGAVGRARPRALGWLRAGLHFCRWCLAALFALVLSLSLLLVVCLSAPMHVIDSRDFWVEWAERSQAMRALHRDIDAWLDRAAATGAAAPRRAGFADPALLAGAIARVRPEVHHAFSGHVIDALVGFSTGRDERLELDLGLRRLRQHASERIASAILDEQCKRDSGSTGCRLSAAALNGGAHDALLSALSAELDDFNPFTGRFAATLPVVGPSRLWFSGLRAFLVIAPLVLCGWTLLVCVLSLRLRTATFMLGSSALGAGVGAMLAGLTARRLADACGVSDEVWQLIQARSGSVQAGLGVDTWLMACGALLLLVRLLGPRFRANFWTRRVGSTDSRVCALATRGLSAPASLLEPWHMLTAWRR